MLALRKAFGQLCVVVGGAAHAPSHGSALSKEVTSRLQPLLGAAAQLVGTQRSFSQSVPHQAEVKAKASNAAKVKGSGKSYDTPSPFRNPGPRRYGYQPGFFTDGLLPRGEDLGPVRSLPKYKAVDKWHKKRALFGQNDYIDILGDGSIRPVDLIHGPDWLIGFKGNELQRLVRKMHFHGDRLRLLYPHKHRNIQKRIFFLHKKYNQKRGKRVGSQRRS